MNLPNDPDMDQRNTVSRRKAMLGFAAASSLFLHLSAAQAGPCTVFAGGQYVDYLRVDLPAWDSATFDPNVPDGTVVFSGTGQATGLAGKVECPTYLEASYDGKGPVGRFNTYATSVAGIGVRIKGGAVPDQWWPNGFTWTVNGVNFKGGGDFTVELVKTGRITAAGALTGEIGTTTLVNQQNQVIRRIFITGSLPIRPLVPTCKVTTPSVAVPLGSIPTYAFKAVGTKTELRPFEIRLQCSGGSQGTATRMYMTMTDASDPSNRSSVLTLSSNSKATGVGIRILRGSDDSVVWFGADSSASNNQNQWFIGEYGNNTVTIPLKAQYYQRAAQVTPGPANGLATFTMSYQ
ncbi:fimbrial protein [Cupriavidus sp. UME77]|uniref:fimbrial protein n=1 Tax=Cupriavidus sp. UME77 TaxID=1862321 RepID=UPI002104FD02|nr:fimbrial protein [Cupriavidus sp. UME77]